MKLALLIIGGSALAASCLMWALLKTFSIVDDRTPPPPQDPPFNPFNDV